MTMEEYKAAKSAMYKKYKAGEITNYAYIQWKKKNNPDLQGNTPQANPGTQAADAAVAKLEKELKKIYGAAAKEMQAQLKELEKHFNEVLPEMSDKLYNGEITQAQYDKWLQTQILTKDIVKQKIDQLSGTALDANKKALGMVNGQQVNVFAENANYQAYQLTQDTGLNLMFSIYDERTAEKLIKEKPELLPRKEVNGKKDKAWNQKVIANAVTRALIQGESIPKLAKRIATDTASTNMKAMVRYARTAMTSAQNSGRMEMLHQAKGMGIKVKKKWLATLDSRTRDVHAHLDGQVADVDDPFHSKLGDILFPGDLGSKGSVPANVYNCRCTLIYDYEGFPNDPTEDQRLMYDEYYTTETDAKGKEHKVFHRESRLITDMDYDEWKAAKEGTKLNELNAAKTILAEAQKAFIKANVKGDKQYEGIWKDPVTLADYANKKGAIQAKRDYFTAEIQKYKDAQAQGASWATDEKIKDLEKKRKLLNEFEKNGELLEKRNAALKAVQDIYDQVGFQKTAAAPNAAQIKAKKAAKKAGQASAGTNAGAAGQSGAGLNLGAAGAKKTQFSPDAWDDKTKKAARNFRSKEIADKEIRPELDAMWDTLTDDQKYAVWEYTRNSHPMNQPLSGFNDGWGRSRYFVGLENTIWGHQDNYSNRNFYDAPDMAKFGKNGHPSYHKAITKLTEAIEKSSMQKDMWLVRGSDEEGFAGLFERGGTGGLDFHKVMSLLNGNYGIADIRKALVGQTGQNHAFTSTGIATGTGFHDSVKYRIFAPKGTKGIYAEPQSYWGGTSRRGIYKKGASYGYVGNEAEIIVQRGTRYRITGVSGVPGDWTIEMEVVEQPDYFRHCDENTYNDGKTRQSR